MALNDTLPHEYNLKDTDDKMYFVMGLSTGILIGTLSTFVGNILTHKWMVKNGNRTDRNG